MKIRAFTFVTLVISISFYCIGSQNLVCHFCSTLLKQMKVFTFSIPVVVSIALMLLSLQHYHVFVVDAKLGTLGLGLQSGALLFLLEGETSGLGVDFHRIPYSDFAGVGNFPEHPNLWDAIKGKFFLARRMMAKF